MSPESNSDVEVIARSLTKARKQAIRYYSLEHISPKSDEKIRHPYNTGWTIKAADWLLDRGLLRCGENGWHVLTDLGRAVALYLSKQNGEKGNG